MEYIPHNVVHVELNKQKLKAYINNVESAKLVQSNILDPLFFIKDVEKLYLDSFTGIILLDLAEAQKVVYVKSGEVIFARSSVNDERLGETLCRMGKLTTNELNKASKEITPNRRLGKILVENGHITSRELWLGVKRQIFEIWGSYIMPVANHTNGWFHVIKSEIDDINVVKPNSNMLESLFEFLRERADSVNINMESEDLVHLNYLTNSVSFNIFEQSIIKHLLKTNDVTVTALAKEINADFESTGTALKPLIYIGILDIVRQLSKAEYKTEDVKIGELINLTNTIMTSIAEIMDKKAPDVNFKDAVKDYIKLSDGIFKNCKINEQCCFDVSSFMEIYKNSQLLSPYDESVVFIKELIQFELFEMKNYLSKDQTEELENIIDALG
jgi:predicted transcriptional regulator